MPDSGLRGKASRSPDGGREHPDRPPCRLQDRSTLGSPSSVPLWCRWFPMSPRRPFQTSVSVLSMRRLRHRKDRIPPSRRILNHRKMQLEVIPPSLSEGFRERSRRMELHRRRGASADRLFIACLSPICRRSIASLSPFQRKIQSPFHLLSIATASPVHRLSISCRRSVHPAKNGRRVSRHFY